MVLIIKEFVMRGPNYNQFRCIKPNKECDWYIEAKAGDEPPPECPRCGSMIRTTCGSKLRKKPGKRCGIPVTLGKRCSIHGGKSRKGPASGRWRDGQYSKYCPIIPTSWQEQFNAALLSGKLGGNETAIATMMAMADAIAGRIDQSSPKERVRLEEQLANVLMQLARMRDLAWRQSQKVSAADLAAYLGAIHQRVVSAAQQVIGGSDLSRLIELLQRDRSGQFGFVNDGSKEMSDD